MDRIVGNSIALIVGLFFLPVYGSLSLQLTDIQGHQLKDAQAGEPFLLVVSIADVDDQTQEPKIKGMQDFYVKRIGYRMTTKNGDKSAQYTYQVRIDRPGSYLLGPAYDPDTSERSQAVRIKVESGTGRVGRQVRRNQKEKQIEPVLLRLWVDNDTVFVGQKIKTVLRFYVPEDTEISVEQIISNDPATMQVSEKSGPKKGTQEIEGKRYIYYEWHWDMFARTAGQLVVPAYSLDYTKHLSMDQFMGAIATFFGPRYERKRVYSNALTLQVRLLPEVDQPVDAVGRFINYRAQISPAVAKQYEGMVLSLSVEGDGNVEQLQAPELERMPAEFKWYASKSYMQELPIGQRKTFEYIVQGLKDGDWELPEQSFTFFDVDARAYKQLHTAPIFMNILPGNIPIQEHATGVCLDDNRSPLHHMQPIIYDFNNHNAVAPWSLWWFVILMLLPLIMMLCYCSASRSGWLMRHIAPRYAKRRAFSYAGKQLAHAYRYHNTQSLHAIFLQLFAIRNERSAASLTTDEINTMIANSLLTEENKQRWRSFFATITEVTYAGSAGPKEVLRLFHEAAVWLQELERII